MLLLSEVEQFNTIVGQLYDAALAQEHWASAISGIKDLLGAKAAVFAFRHHQRKVPDFIEYKGYDEFYLRQYLDEYYKIDPIIEKLSSLTAGEVACISKHENFKTLNFTRFYNEWLQPQGIENAMMLCVDRTLLVLSSLIVVSGKEREPFNKRDLYILELLYPHLRRAAMFRHIVGEAKFQADAFGDFIDQLASGVFFLSRSGEIVHVNATGKALLEAKAALHLYNGRVILQDDQAQSALRMTLEYLGADMQNVGDLGQTIPVRTPGGDYMVHIVPTRTRHDSTLGGYHAADFIMCVREEDPISARAIENMARQYRLTPQESRTLATVVDVGGIPLAANVLGLSPATVRSYIQSIFDKTGVRTQAGLIRLLSSSISPFAR